MFQGSHPDLLLVALLLIITNPDLFEASGHIQFISKLDFPNTSAFLAHFMMDHSTSFLENSLLQKLIWSFPGLFEDRSFAFPRFGDAQRSDPVFSLTSQVQEVLVCFGWVNYSISSRNSMHSPNSPFLSTWFAIEQNIAACSPCHS